MKRTIGMYALMSVLILMSCSKDDSDSENNIDQLAEQMESTPLEANLVADNVVIDGGTKKDGMPPTPNEAISLDISGAGTSAILNEGFKVPLESDGAIVGAYIQFKSDDGTIADSYYDVNLSGNGDKGYNLTKGSSTFLTSKSGNKSAKESIELDIDFGDLIEPGTFCYVLCVYDGQENISAPQEVCVTVESWGGYSKLVGEWNLVKEEFTYDGVAESRNLGDTECDSMQSQGCEGSNDEFTYIPSCRTTSSFTIMIKADGTYDFRSEGTRTELDYDASAEACDAVYIEYDNIETSTGNWAYAEDTKELTVVEYAYYEKDRGEVEEGTWEEGDARLIFSGKAEVDGDNLVLSQDDFDEIFKLYLEK